MLRLLVAVLLVANLVFWAWSQPQVAERLGWSPDTQTEPGRLAAQVQPDRIRVRSAGSSAPKGVGSSVPAGPGASSVSGQAPLSTLACLETPALNASQLPLANRALQQAGVPPGAWVEMRRDVPGRWWIFMGRFSDPTQRDRKGAELAELKVDFEPMNQGDLAPGLLLGTFDHAASAQARLAQLQAIGVRSARVVQVTPPSTEWRLRADRLDEAAQLRLRQAAASAPSDLTWLDCPR